MVVVVCNDFCRFFIALDSIVSMFCSPLVIVGGLHRFLAPHPTMHVLVF
jgi:hypothetical protein